LPFFINAGEIFADEYFIIHRVKAFYSRAQQ
jgi:hypothetical protein